MKGHVKKENLSRMFPFGGRLTILLWSCVRTYALALISALTLICLFPASSHAASSHAVSSRAISSRAAIKMDKVLVTVDKRKITVQDFIDFHQTRPRIAHWNNPQNSPNNPNSSNNQNPNSQGDPKETLDTLVGKVLMAEEASRLFPDTLKNAQQELADFEQVMLINVFTDEQIDKGIKISEQEVDRRVPENQKVEVHLRRIVVSTQEEALRLRKQLVKGQPSAQGIPTAQGASVEQSAPVSVSVADFKRLARKFSLGEEAQKGGDIGYMAFDQGIFPKDVVEKIFQLKNGEITGPASIREGYALFQMTGRRKVTAQALERYKQYIRQQIRLERQRERWDELLQQLNRESGVVINEALFKQIEQDIARNQGSLALNRMSGMEIARVKDHTIRVEEIIPNDMDPTLKQSRPWEKDAQMLRRLLDRKVKTILVADYARRLHYDQSGEVKKSIVRFKDDLMVRRLVAEGIYKGLSVSQEECRNYYQAHLLEYRVPERVEISQICVSDEKTAVDIMHQLKEGANFNELSQKYPSSDSLTPKGFWARGGSGMGKEFEEKVFGLRLGEVTGPVKASNKASKGRVFHIVKLLDRQQEGYAPLAEVESRIRENLLSVKKEKALNDHIAALRRKSKVAVDETLFQEVIKNAL